MGAQTRSLIYTLAKCFKLEKVEFNNILTVKLYKLFTGQNFFHSQTIFRRANFSNIPLHKC